MGLLSIHADNTASRKKDRNRRRNSKSLKEFEESHKKYSLADLDSALEKKYNPDQQITKYQDKNGNISEEQPQKENIKDTTKIRKEVFSNEAPPELGQTSVNGGLLHNDNTLQNSGEEEDILMEDMQNQNDIEMVSNYLTQQRLQVSTAISENGTNVNTNNFAQYNITSLEPTQLQTVYVVDTNFIISQLHTLEELRELSEKYHHVLVIPTTAIAELDGLKSSNSEKIARHARAGNNWIYKNLAISNSGILGQKLRQRLDYNTLKDDSILDCCLYFREKLGCFVILLSNDKNLCLKALTEEVLTVSYREGMTSELIASRSYEENCARFGNTNHSTNHMNLQPKLNTPHPGDNIQVANNIHQSNLPNMTFQEKSKLIHNDIQFVVIATIKSIMNDEYGDDLPYVGFEEDKLKSLEACARCVYNYWVAVFAPYFRNSKFRKEDWKMLPRCLTTEPESQKNIDDIIFFWQDILEHLFIKKSEKDYSELVKYFFKWRQFKSSGLSQDFPNS
ncbi:transcriptional protein Swt1p [Monosporozyma unispora]|nr:hypothetical protein C6P44_002476 [Kazachstania unispora]